MTNADIIFNARMQLAKDGKIAMTEEGPEEIHTYDHWKKLGYQVLRGEKAVCKLNIWKPIKGKGKRADEQAEDEQDKKEPAPWMVPKTAFFFSRSQVDSVV